jgi:hypothetical protein
MSDIENRIDTWVHEGLVTPEQANAIRAFEDQETPSSVKLSPWAEVAVYVGLIFGLASGAALFLRGFHGPTPRLIAQGVVALVGLFFGTRIISMEGRSRVRIGSVILAFGTAGTFGFAVDLLQHQLKVSLDSSLLVSSALVLILSLWQWGNRDRFAQFLTTLASAAGLVASTINVLSWHPAPEVVASLFYVPAMLLVVFRNRLRPTLMVLTAGTAIASIAAQGYSANHQWVGCAIGLATAGFIFALARHERHTSVVVIAGGFAFFALVRLYLSYIHGGGALAVVFVASVALFAVIYRRVLAPSHNEEIEPASDVASQS